MQVGPHGEGELQVLVRMLCAVAGGVFGALFADTVAGNFDRRLSYAALGGVFVTVVLVTVFLPEVSRILARRRGRSG
jgi:drug/metabolite transporter superfamily protein YnfA